MPVTYPMGRNIIGYASGANHRVYNLLNFLVLAIFMFSLLSLFGYIPTCILKSFNITNALVLWKGGKIFGFWKFNKFYQIMVVLISLGMMLTDVSIILISGMAITFLYYVMTIKKKEIKQIRVYWNQKED